MPTQESPKYFILYSDQEGHRQAYPNISLGESGLTDTEVTEVVEADLENLEPAADLTQRRLSKNPTEAQAWVAGCPKCEEFIKSF